MSERPEYPKGAFWLDRDVAEHIILVADRYFGGDRDLALNELVRVTMAMYARPDDLWAGIERQKLAHWRGERAQRLNDER